MDVWIRPIFQHNLLRVIHLQTLSHSLMNINPIRNTDVHVFHPEVGVDNFN